MADSSGGVGGATTSRDTGLAQDQKAALEFTELVTGSVYQLRPQLDHYDLDVVFFHGLQLGDYKLAWRTTWEKAPTGPSLLGLLAAEMPTARILSVSYNSSATKSGGGAGETTFPDLAKMICDNLLGTLVNVGQNRPVVFVGHSLGGIIMKQVYLEACKWAKTPQCALFQDNLKGMLFYGTPHNGSMLADVALFASWLVGLFVRPGEVVKVLKVFNSNAANNADEFSRRLEESETNGTGRVRILAFYETLHVKVLWGWLYSGLVVSQASAQVGSDKARPIAANHMDMCKPSAANDALFDQLQAFIKTLLPRVMTEMEEELEKLDARVKGLSSGPGSIAVPATAMALPA